MPEDLLGAVGSIELHGKRDQLEEHQDRIAGDADINQAGHVEKKAADDHEGENLRGELGRRDDLHPEIERPVVELVLEGVTALVRGDPDGGDRVAVVDIGREAESLVTRIVVIAEHVVDFLNADIMDSGVGKDPARGLGTGHPRGGGDLLVGLEGGGDAKLRPESEGQGHTDQKDVEFKCHGCV